MVLGCTFRGWFLAFPQLSMPVVRICFHRRVGAGHADHVCCSVQQRNCLVFLEVSPVLHNCSSEVTKANALPADSTLQSCGNNCWIKQRGKKLPVGPQSKLETHERKNRIQKNLTEKQWEKPPARLYGTKARVLKKLSKLFPHPINIFFSTYGMSLSQLPPPEIPISDYP